MIETKASLRGERSLARHCEEARKTDEAISRAGSGQAAQSELKNEIASRFADARGRNDKSLLSRIGNTPLVPLRKIGAAFPGVELLAKLEWFNPGGSVKDRAAHHIIQEAEESGQLRPDKIILDASSGNTGVALAMIGTLKGYKVRLCIPSNAAGSIIQTMRAFGADVVTTSPLESSDGAIREARRLYQENPGLYFYADQYNNPANWKAHEQTTGPEIWNETAGGITHFVAGLGTSGTLMGTGRFLKEQNPGIQLVAVQPDSPIHGLEGLKHMATSIVPGIFDPKLADLNLEISTEEAYTHVKRLSREEGLLAGISSGAALAAGLRLARQIQEGTIVIIFPDGGERYLNEQFWKS